MRFDFKCNDKKPKVPCIMEMSNIDFGSPSQLFQPYQHAPCAEKFHRYLKEKTGIDAVATFAYGSLAVFPQMQLYLWVMDSVVTEQILQNTPHCPCRRDHPLFRLIIGCLLDALREDGNKALADVSKLWDMQQTNDAGGEKQIYVSITLLSYLRCYTDDLFGATKDAVTHTLTEQFPTYERFLCGAYSLESGPLAHNHLYLFMTPQDQEKATASGDIEKMRKLAYDIIRARDVHGYVPYEVYTPQIANRRELTSDQIFFIVRE